MIYLTRLNHELFILNSDLIETVETTPDTVLSLTTGEKLRVRESAAEVINLVIDFRRTILAGVRECDLAGRTTLVRAGSGRSSDALA